MFSESQFSQPCPEYSGGGWEAIPRQHLRDVSSARFVNTGPLKKPCLFFFFDILFYLFIFILAAPGLRCGTWDLLGCVFNNDPYAFA